MAGIKSHAMILLAAAALAAGTSRADTVFLNSGIEINGTIVHQDEQTVVVRTSNGKTRSIRKSDVDTIIREKAPAAVAVREDPAAAKALPVEPVRIEPVKIEAPVKPDGAHATAPVKADGPKEVITPDIIKNELKGESKKIDAVKSDDTRAENVKVETAFPENPPPVTKPIVASDAGSGPPPVPNFPENSKRMSRRKEALFTDAVAALRGPPKSQEDNSKEAAMSDIQALGPEVLPYLWAGLQSEDGDLRIAAMRLLGNMNARNCVKRAIETFYATMPEASAVATWNVPMIRAIKTTLPALTGQSYITVEPNRVGVQDGLKKYVEWYNANYERLPKQVGEPDLDITDPEYAKKLKELRQLKLAKREWPAPPNQPVDLVRGPNTNSPDKGPAPIVRFDERPKDKEFGKSIPKIEREDALKRPSIDTPVAPTRPDALKRDVDKRNEEAQKAASGATNNKRDPVGTASIDSKTKKADPLVRTIDSKKAEEK